MDYTLVLPDEIWVKIAGYLSQYQLCKLSLVSRQCLNIARDPILWTNIRILDDVLVNTQSAVTLIERCTLLTELEVAGRTDTTDILKSVANSCHKIKILTIQKCSPLNYSDLQLLSDNCHQIQSLNLSETGCLNKNGDVHSYVCCNFGLPCACSHFDSFTNLLKNFCNLSVLDLFQCSNLHNKGLEQIADLCPNLTYLNIGMVQYLTDDSVNYFITKVKATLKHLLIYGETLTDESFTKFSDLKNLIELKVAFCDNMESAGFHAIAHLSSLQRLTLWQGFNITPQDYIYVFSHNKLRNLIYLDLSECLDLYDDGLICISKNCPSLTGLLLCWCVEVTDLGLCYVATRCKLLRDIDLTGCAFLNGAFLRYIPGNLNDLQSIKLLLGAEISYIKLSKLKKWKPDLEIMDYRGQILSFMS